MGLTMKNTSKIALISICATALAACQSSGPTVPSTVSAAGTSNVAVANTAPQTMTHEQMLASWNGREVDELLLFWGAPHETTDLPRGGLLVTYVSEDEVAGNNMAGALMGTLVGGAIGSTLETVMDNSGEISEYACVVNFRINTAGYVQGAVIQQEDTRTFGDLCGDLIKPAV